MSDAGFGKGAQIIDTAVGGFAAELGRQVQMQRMTAGLTTESFTAILNLAGVTLQPRDIESLEVGQGPALDLKLLTALVFTLELSVDRVIFACLQEASTDPSSG
ncbi:MAG: hypothetical protein H7Z41_11725 [Cytophagales bacterium]|nr:hypothetical protein [Armatimonadota bacterium]